MFNFIRGKARLRWVAACAFVAFIPFVAWSLNIVSFNYFPAPKPPAPRAADVGIVIDSTAPENVIDLSSNSIMNNDRLSRGIPALRALSPNLVHEISTRTNVINLLLNSVSNPDSGAQGIPGLSTLDLKAIDKEIAQPGMTDEQRLFIKILLAEARATGADVPTPGLLKTAITKYVLAPRLSVEQTAERIADELAQVSTLANNGEKGRLPSIEGTSQLLVPYLYQAGMCSGDIGTSTGLICGYLQPSEGTTSAGTIKGDGAAPDMKLQAPPDGSDLSKILQLATSKYQTRASARSSAADSSGGVGTCFDVPPISSGRFVVLRLTNLQYIAYVATIVPPTSVLAYLGNFLLGLLEDELLTVELYGEYYAATNVRYLADDSDSAFLVYPYGFRCRVGECKAFGECAAQPNADALACGAAHGTRIYSDLRRFTSSAMHSIAACKAVPIPYQSRIPYQAVQQDLYKLPYGLKFQTKNQVSPSQIVSPSDLHLYPAPTSYSGPEAPYPGSELLDPNDPTWRYDFTKVSTWEPNFIFAGLKSVNTSAVASCAGSRQFYGDTAYGDSFWMWHGEGQGKTFDCKSFPYILDISCPGYIGLHGVTPTPSVNFIFGQQLAHSPVLCAVPPPPCTSVDCVPPPPTPPCSGLDCIPPVPPTPQTSALSVLSATATQSNTQMVSMKFTVRRDGDTSGPVSVSFETSDKTAKAGQDYVANIGTLNFATAQVQAEISVDVLPGHSDGGVKFFNVNLLNASGATIAASRAYGAIIELGTLTPLISELVDFGKTVPAVAVGSGYYYSCALLSNGNVQCWGRNTKGETAGYSGRMAKAVSLDGFHSCALMSLGNVQCWGADDLSDTVGFTKLGNLGVDTSAGYSGGNATALSVGYIHSCALLSTGNVQCWGFNNYGQSVGYSGGNATAVSAGVQHSCALLTNGNVQCWGRNDTGESAGYSGGNAISVSAGYGHSCALLSNGNVQCWGGPYDGYSGGNATAVAVGRSSCALLTNGNVQCWGSNSEGESDGYSGGSATALTSGRYHSCTLLSSGNVRCWGRNGTGQSIGYSGGNATAVSVGISHSCALLSNGNVRCWGSNGFGQSAGYGNR